MATLLPLLIVVALFAVMVIVPGRRRARDQQNMRSNLAPGVDVMTTAGLYGRVDAIDTAQGTVDVEISDGVIVRFTSQAIARVIPSHSDEQSTDEDDEQEPAVEETDQVATDDEHSADIGDVTDEAATDGVENDAGSPRGPDGTNKQP